MQQLQFVIRIRLDNTYGTYSRAVQPCIISCKSLQDALYTPVPCINILPVHDSKVLKDIHSYLMCSVYHSGSLMIKVSYHRC